jgi:sarcosine oxidase
LGSHGGQSRIIRKAYFEHPDYVPLLERSYQNWKSLEEETGAQLYFKTGLLYFGKAEHALIKGLRESASKYSIRVDTLSEQEQERQFPQFNIPSGYERLIEPDAGFLLPERSVLLYTQQAIRAGATIHTKEKTIEWKKSGSTITVKTSKATYQCKKLIITAGPWATKMVPNFSKNLKVTRQMIAWVKPKDWSKFELGNFPCWTIADHERPGIFYGFPILPVAQLCGPIGLKLAHHFHGTVSDPDTINRIPTPADEDILVSALNKFMPEGYESTHVMKTCMYTNTPDENFILDFVPGYEKEVVVATGFSGHGFKFASVVGEIMADLAMKGSTRQPIGFLNAQRFS